MESIAECNGYNLEAVKQDHWFDWIVSPNEDSIIPMPIRNEDGIQMVKGP